ncbi:bifunctional hydroxymethylpyrimidine kinase/phosphomethylpyrimidine kinase [Arthrobacter pigmenti]
MNDAIPRVLSVAGTDPTGGAGIQADLKSIAANGGYGMAVVTALVAQNTQGVRSVHTPPEDFLWNQLTAVSDDVTLEAVKIGMLGNIGTTAVVDQWLSLAKPPLVVLDPIMIATSGDRLLDPGAEEALRTLLRRADLVTPNLQELGVLLDEPTATKWPQALEQGHRLSAAKNLIVLVKGGHLDGPHCPDALVDTAGRLGGDRHSCEVTADRVKTANTHGTGCSMSSAIATLQARLDDWEAALNQTKSWLQDSLLHADELHIGTGSGPLHHFHRLWNDPASVA